jgi:antitoxin component of MazEF toxin-antitoxin module
MKPIPLKVARIGNSRGVRLPADTLLRYQIGAEVLMEERSDGILLRAPGTPAPKLSWEETASAMAAESEDWGEWESVAGDGLGDITWEASAPRRAAGPPAEYPERPRKRRP